MGETSQVSDEWADRVRDWLRAEFADDPQCGELDFLFGVPHFVQSDDEPRPHNVAKLAHVLAWRIEKLDELS